MYRRKLMSMPDSTWTLEMYSPRRSIEHGLVGVLVLPKLNKMNSQGKAYRITLKAFGIEHGLVD